MDYIARALTMDGFIRIFAASTTDMVNEAVKIHDCYPTAAAALGRMMTAAAMMGSMLKEEKGSVTLQISGGGPLGRVVAVADCEANVKAYCDNPHLQLPLNGKGKLDVGGAVGKEGYLSVVRDLGMKEPYVGQTPIVSGEIAEDITAYYATSEQIPSAVALGVLVDTDCTIKAAGGFILQIMPGAPDEVIDRVEEVIANIPPVTEMISNGKTPEEIIEAVLPDAGIFFYENTPTAFFCDCSRERIERALLSIGKKELSEIIETDGKAELTCHFCSEKYQFNKEELTSLLSQATRE